MLLKGPLSRHRDPEYLEGGLWVFSVIATRELSGEIQ